MEQNKEIILDLVRKHFFLSKDGFEKFEHYLREPYIDEIFKPMIGEDNRAYFDLKGIGFSHEHDQGWKKFNNVFCRLNMNGYVKYNYENYKTNKIIINKNERKLVKYIEEILFEKMTNAEAYKNLGMYVEYPSNETKSKEWLKNYFKNTINEIGAIKTPDKGMQLVLSYNFADWLLCSTAESWSSCVSCECEYGGSYWTGLPGLVGDKNRIMLYITDGAKKKYQGIVVDRLLSRRWLVMNKKNELYSLRAYPNEIVSPEDILKATGLKVRTDYARDFVSKYPVELITFETGQSCQIYQDGFGIREDRFISYGHSGYNYLDKNGKSKMDAIFIYNSGLSTLIRNKESIGKYKNVTVICQHCGNGVREGEFKLGPDERVYCNYCWNSKWFNCNRCGELHEFREKHEVNGMIGYYCKGCYDKEFLECKDCKKVIGPKDPAKYPRFRNGPHFDVEGKIVCERCYYNNYATCNSCGHKVAKDRKIKTKTGNIYCLDCAKTKGVKLAKKRA